ncbi:MAG: aconitate hydratase AcnA [Myxococcales bacterium]|nr:aconitate hydratase AcnA [Myxococcales bacterium]
MSTKRKNSFHSHTTLMVGGKAYRIANLTALRTANIGNVDRLPYSLRILLENLLRNEDGITVNQEDIVALASWRPENAADREIAYRPARVLLQDFTGVPVVVDLAAMREAVVRMGGNGAFVNPLQPVDLVIDHSVQVDYFGTSQAFDLNKRKEYERNTERYEFLRWGQTAFDRFQVVPPGTGIVHQVNLEYLAQAVLQDTDPEGETWAYPDTLVGTDSHTTMINGLGVLGWGVGGIEAEAAMLGQPVAMLIPDVVGFRMVGQLPTGATATDLVLTVTEILRRKKVVGKFVEFFGPGIAQLGVADRATVANMAPEYGATVGFFPIDALTLDFLRFTGRNEDVINLVEAYCKTTGLFYLPENPEPLFTEVVELDLSTVVPSIAGPKRPQDRIPLAESKKSFRKALVAALQPKLTDADPHKIDAYVNGESPSTDLTAIVKTTLVESGDSSFEMPQGAVTIAAITSCTNTSNPSVMLGAGLLAQKAVARGLRTKPWVKTSLAPGSTVVTDYLARAGVSEALDELGFQLVGYGCTSCIGNSGPLPENIVSGLQRSDLVAAAVLSGNRNFEGRVNPHTRLNYLASPPLVVAYALVGHMDVDFETDPIGYANDGTPTYLRDIWPSRDEISVAMSTAVTESQFRQQYQNVFSGDNEWKNLPIPTETQYKWDEASTYIRNPPFFDGLASEPTEPVDITNARVLALLGDSVTTDHISPAGNIPAGGPAGKYLIAHGVAPKDFNSFGARRGNHEVMMRGTFANIRIKNLLVPGVEGGVTRHLPTDEQMSIYDASMRYQADAIPLIIVAGKEYGTGSSRDWAAKGTALLGVRAVIAESFERIHRSNLVGMGVLPLEFIDGQNAASLGLSGEETFTISGIATDLKPRKRLTVRTSTQTFEVLCRIDTPVEVDYYRHGGILQYVLRQLLQKR